MIAIFCNNPIKPQWPDDLFVEEYRFAAEHFQTALMSHELLTAGRADAAISKVRAQDQMEWAVYRGWMVTPEQYTALYEALLAKNIRLMNTPAQYRLCHYLPEAYPFIRDHTPKTLVFPAGTPMTTITQQLQATFGSRPIIVKDYVKSQKGLFDEAFFIPAADNAEKVAEVVNNFLAIQGDMLAEGLVFREFVPLRLLDGVKYHNLPVSVEYRIFVCQHRPLIATNYWGGLYPEDCKPPIDQIMRYVKDLDSQFFTVDVAQTAANEWVVIETGDAQVSGLQTLSPQIFYAALITDFRP